MVNLSELCKLGKQTTHSVYTVCTLHQYGILWLVYGLHAQLGVMILLLNKRKITMTGDDFRISTRAIYFARWPVNGIGGGAARCRLDRALTMAISSDQTFHVLSVRHMMRMRIPSICIYMHNLVPWYCFCIWIWDTTLFPLGLQEKKEESLDAWCFSSNLLDKCIPPHQNKIKLTMFGIGIDADFLCDCITI